MWEFRFYETDLDGSRNRKSLDVGPVSEFPSESAVRKSPVLQALLLRINSNERTSLPDFGAVIARYEQEEMPQRYSTSAAYKSYLKNHIRPRWAAMPLIAVKTMAVEDWLKRLALAPKSKSHIRSLMHVLFRCAQRWELTDKNPIELVRVRGGSKRVAAPRVLTPEQFCALATMVVEPFQTQIWIAGCLGLRASEIMPLRWADFDFERLTVLIDRSIVHGRLDELKTEYSRDRVPLDPALIEILLEHKDRCTPTSEGWLFANPVTGRPYHQDTIQQKHMRTAGKQAGLGDGIGWYTFRHSYRSWLDDTGAPMTVQKELMRHASIQTTMNVYGKAMSSTKREAHSKVVQVILPGRKTRQIATDAA